MAASDGELRNLSFTSVPEPDKVQQYIELALTPPDRFAFAVIDESTQQVIGSTSYHDIRPLPKRLEIGYTWYAQRYWRTHQSKLRTYS